MKKMSLSFFLLSITCNILFAQKGMDKDSLTILQNDIYSNFNKDVYAPSKAFKVFVNSKGDSVKVLSTTYEATVSSADRLLEKQDFVNASFYYNKAFSDNNGLGKVKDRYKLAVCYAMSGNNDSAFIQLERIVDKGKYYNIEEISSETPFKSLHKDSRWQTLLLKVSANKKELKDDLHKSIPQH